MKTLHTSISSRLFGLAVAIALIAGGVVAITQPRTAAPVPLVIGLAMMPALLGVALGIRRHVQLVVLATALGIYGTFLYTIGLGWIITRHHQLGYGLIALGVVILVATLYAHFRSGPHGHPHQTHSSHPYRPHSV